MDGGTASGKLGGRQAGGGTGGVLGIVTYHESCEREARNVSRWVGEVGATVGMG